MKKIILAALAVSALSSAPATAEPAALFNWTGFYFGGGVSQEKAKLSSGTASFSTQQSSVSPIVSGSFTPHDTESKFNGQLFAGYRAQFSSFVAGIEASLNLDAKKTFASLPNPVCNIPTASNACVAAAPFGVLRDYGRIRAVGGYLIAPNLLGFGSVGAVFGQGNPYGFRAGSILDNGTTSSLNTSTFSDVEKKVTGWTFGGGLENMISDHWSLRGEYIYDRFPSFSVPTTTSTTVLGPGASGSASSLAVSNDGKAKFSQQSFVFSAIYKY